MVAEMFSGWADNGQAEGDLLAEIIRERRLFPVYQPIIDLRSGECLGHEALIRGPIDTPLHAPYHLFNAAIRHQQLHRLELLCRRASLEGFAVAKLPGKLFLNVSASLLSTPEHQHGFTADLLEELGLPQERLVIELSEQHPFDHHGLTRAAVEHYRQMGFHIAIDDLGSGYSGLKLWSELRPDYVKIDMHFVRGIDRDSVKREFVRSICNIGHSLHCRIIAEGIETLEELHTLQEMGVRYGQGYLLGRPDAAPVMPFDPVAIRRGYVEGSRAWRSVNTETAQVLARPIPAVSPDERLCEVSEILRQHPQISSVPVLIDGEPVGIVRRAELLELFSSQYGRALYEQKPVSRLLRQEMLVVDCETPLEQVSQLITEQDEAQTIQQELVITLEGCYLGMGSVRELLKRITELKIRNARHANPLTLLPGTVPINREIDALLQRAADFHVAHFDLNGFKQYNTVYGYPKGDQVLRQLGFLLARHIDPVHNFMGHAGADDFIVLFRGRDWRSACERIQAEFQQLLAELYRPQHLAAGGFWQQEVNGKSHFVPLLSLAVAVVHPDPYKCTSHHEVAELSAEAHRIAKQQGGAIIHLSAERSLRQPWREFARDLL